MARWHLYILRCGDKTLYTGIAVDIRRRLAEHRAGRGSKYVRSRLPVRLVYQEKLGSRSSALKREAQIKRLTRRTKLAMLAVALAFYFLLSGACFADPSPVARPVAEDPAVQKAREEAEIRRVQEAQREAVEEAERFVKAQEGVARQRAIEEESLRRAQNEAQKQKTPSKTGRKGFMRSHFTH